MVIMSAAVQHMIDDIGQINACCLNVLDIVFQSSAATEIMNISSNFITVNLLQVNKLN